MPRRATFPLALRWPGRVDHVLGVLPQRLLQLRAGGLGIGARVLVYGAQLGSLQRNGLGHVRIVFENPNRDQRHGQAVEDHHALHHGAAEVRILGADPHARQHVAAHQKQPGQRECAQHQDDGRTGDGQRGVEDGIEHAKHPAGGPAQYRWRRMSRQPPPAAMLWAHAYPCRRAARDRPSRRPIPTRSRSRSPTSSSTRRAPARCW